MRGQIEVGAEGDALPSQALSAVAISLPTSPASPIEQMLGRDPELNVSSIPLIEETGDKRARQSSVRVLTELASGARLFRLPDSHFCAQVRVGDRLEIYGLRSAGFRDRLISINFERRGGDRVVTLKMEGATMGRLSMSRRHEKVAVKMLAPIIQAPSRKHILKNDIWQYSAAGRFVWISQAPDRNSM
jgi:hypothetical protein